MTNTSGNSANGEYPGKELEAMSFAVNYHRWIIQEISPFLGEVVVEVGAGIGDFSSILLDSGIAKLHAFEPSSNLFPTLQRRIGNLENVSLMNGFFNRDSCPPHVDSVVYVNVLEHIERDFEELEEVRHSLEPGKALVVFVPALSWLFSEMDSQMGHFRRYNRTDLTEIVANSGFAIERLRYFDIAGVVPWYLNFVLFKNSFNAKSVSLYDRIVVPVMKRIENTLSPPVGKNLLLIARKK